MSAPKVRSPHRLHRAATTVAYPAIDVSEITTSSEAAAAPSRPADHVPLPARVQRAETAPSNMLAQVTSSAGPPAAAQPRLNERRAAIKHGPGEAFTAFLIASDTSSTLQAFKDLLATTDTPPNAGRCMLETLRERLLPHLKWRQLQLLKSLHERKQAGAYGASAAATNNGRPVLRVLVMGCGPVGLRCAVELAMLGHSVLALEQRTAFARLNVLHLWDWVSNDLAELGIKALDPSVFASADYAHVGTSQLQHSLLKIALILGVQIRLGATVSDIADLRAVEPSKRRSIDWPTDVRQSLDGATPRPLVPMASPAPGLSRLSIMMTGGDADGEHFFDPFPSPDTVPGSVHKGAKRLSEDGAEFSSDVLVDATGARCGLFGTIGFEQVTALKSQRALGVVCNFINRKTTEENALPEGNWAQQYHTARFGGLRDRGVNLQNLVYYRSTGAFSSEATHYFVMTADADSLKAMGALHTLDVPEAQLCAGSNVDKAKLVEYARIAVAEFVPQLAHAELVESNQGVQIFDFSERKVSNRASVLVDAADLGGAQGQQVLVTRVGDALQEPFWPEGLGINRGFLHVLDCADLVQGYAALLGSHGRKVKAGAAAVAARDADAAALIQRREDLFTLVKRVSGTNRLTELKATRDAKQKALQYSIDPATRYLHLPRSLPASNY